MSSQERASGSPAVYLQTHSRAGEQELNAPSLAALYEVHRSALLRYLTGLTGSREDAQEVYHEACGKLLAREQPAVLNLPERYLWRTAQNLAKDRRRRQAMRRRLDPIALFTAVQHSPSTISCLEARERLTLLVRAINKLSPQCRLAFMRRVVDGLSLEEVAKEMRVSNRMVKYHVSRALEHCERFINQAETPRARRRRAR